MIWTTQIVYVECDMWETHLDLSLHTSLSLKGNTRGAGKSSWRRLYPARRCPRHSEGVPEAGGGAGGEGEEEEGGGGEGEGRCGRLGQKSRRSCFDSVHYWPGHHYTTMIVFTPPRYLSIHVSLTCHQYQELLKKPFEQKISGCKRWKPRGEHTSCAGEARTECEADARAGDAQEILNTRSESGNISNTPENKSKQLGTF